MNLSQEAITAINTISNNIPFNESIVINASNKAAIKELRDGEYLVTGKVVKLTRKGKELLTSMGNDMHNYAGSMAPYEYTMIGKRVESFKGVSTSITEEFTFKRERGEAKETVTRVVVHKEEYKGGATVFSWKVKG